MRQNWRASPEDYTEQNMDKGHQNISAYILWNNFTLEKNTMTGPQIVHRNS